MNARFWIWWNGDWVKLPLRPGQEIVLHEGGPTDEGWSYGVESYRNVAGGGLVECGVSASALDCDGRHEDAREYFCLLVNLKANPADEEGRPARPEWNLESNRCRDQFAELAGY